MLSRDCRLQSLLLMTVFDASTTAERAGTRYQWAALMSAAAAGPSAVRVAIAFVAVPLTLRHPGSERSRWPGCLSIDFAAE